MSIRRQGRACGERGMVVALIGMVVMIMVTITALVIDHGFLRNDRRADQKVADAAAAAGALKLGTGTGQEACETALAHLVTNTPGVTAFAGVDCSAFPVFCTPATAAKTATGTAGRYRVQIVHPVPGNHALMSRASALGAPAAPTVAADGSQCERLAVSVELERAPSFGGALGAGAQSTKVHAVAKAGSVLDGERPINLLILERQACHAIVAEGQATLKVGAITGYHGELLPGILAVDSAGYKEDGTPGKNCGTTASPEYGTVHVQGTNARIQADGPPGCPAELTAGTGEGCGFIELLAPGIPGPASPLYCLDKAYWPACTSTGVLRPHPVRMSERRTREPIDHHFNCQNGYGNKPWYGGHPISACPGATEDTDYVDELLGFANGNSTPTGFTTYTGPCTVESDVVIPEGNIVVPCTTFTVKRSVTFTGGNVIFNGSVDVTSSSGSLTIHACGKAGVDTCNPTHPLTWAGERDGAGGWITVDGYDEKQYSSDAAWVVFRNGGGIKKDAQSKVHVYDTTLFFERNAAVSSTQATALSGGSGALVWHAPREGPFDVLAMWSDSPLIHDMGGSATLEMEGVYFAPVARLVFRGGGAQQQVAAQLITERLTVTGSGTLTVVPQIDRSINHYRPPSSAIIR